MSLLDMASNLAIIITPVVIGLGFFFAQRQLVSNRNTRMTEIVLSITARWDGAEMQASRQKVNKLGSNLWQELKAAETENREDFYVLLRVADFFDGIGLLVMEGFLARDMAYDLLGAAEEH